MRSRGASLFQVAGDLVRRLHLEAHVDKPVATYSGGTKRKLSTALALLGKPDLLLLVSSGNPTVAHVLIKDAFNLSDCLSRILSAIGDIITVI